MTEHAQYLIYFFEIQVFLALLYFSDYRQRNSRPLSKLLLSFSIKYFESISFTSTHTSSGYGLENIRSITKKWISSKCCSEFANKKRLVA